MTTHQKNWHRLKTEPEHIPENGKGWLFNTPKKKKTKQPPPPNPTKKKQKTPPNHPPKTPQPKPPKKPPNQNPRKYVGARREGKIKLMLAKGRMFFDLRKLNKITSRGG